jgi:hypothetical protein
LGAFSFANAAAVLVIGDIADIMGPVFNRPLAASQTEQAAGVSFLGGEAGDAIDRFGMIFLGDDLGAVSLDREDLGGIREGQIAGQFGAGPDVADFQSSVGFLDGGMLRGEKPSSPGRRCLAAGWIGYL